MNKMKLLREEIFFLLFLRGMFVLSHLRQVALAAFGKSV